MRLGWTFSTPAPDAAQQECCEPGSTLLCMGLFSRFFVKALPCTAEGTVCRVRDTRSLAPRAYGTNRSSSNTSCSSPRSQRDRDHLLDQGTTADGEYDELLAARHIGDRRPGRVGRQRDLGQHFAAGLVVDP